jgi:hypothetical protein
VARKSSSQTLLSLLSNPQLQKMIVERRIKLIHGGILKLKMVKTLTRLTQQSPLNQQAMQIKMTIINSNDLNNRVNLNM